MMSREQLQDEILLLQCQHGDNNAFEQLVRRWQPPLFNYAYRLTGNRDVAWDAVQETWIAAIEGITKLRDVSRFRAWVYRVLNNKCQDHWRRHHRDEELAERVSVQNQQTGERENGTLGNLESAFQRLAAESRSVLALMYLEDFSVAEMAEILNVPEGTIKSRLHHARERLRALMEESKTWKSSTSN